MNHTDETMLAYVPDYRAGHADGYAEGYAGGYEIGHELGVRSGEWRMLWNVVIGAEWSHAFRVSIASHAQTQRTALDVLSASGDEVASRVLMERGW